MIRVIDPEAGSVWLQYGACAQDPDRHITRGEVGGHARIKAAQAAHICESHCPVMIDCLENAKQNRRGLIGIVQGGEHWVRDKSRRDLIGVPTSAPLPDPGCGPWCAHLRGIVRPREGES